MIHIEIFKKISFWSFKTKNRIEYYIIKTSTKSYQNKILHLTFIIDIVIVLEKQ